MDVVYRLAIVEGTSFDPRLDEPVLESNLQVPELLTPQEYHVVYDGAQARFLPQRGEGRIVPGAVDDLVLFEVYRDDTLVAITQYDGATNRFHVKRLERDDHGQPLVCDEFTLGQDYSGMPTAFLGTIYLARRAEDQKNLERRIYQ